MADEQVAQDMQISPDALNELKEILVKQNEMSRRAYGQPLGNALDHAENYRFDYFYKRHFTSVFAEESVPPAV